jgi:formyl-CoA transferase
MPLPLSGINVLEIAQVLAGPFAAQLLADQGAEVIKIEPPEGDSARGIMNIFPEASGISLGFMTFNRNKRSLCLDITRDEGLKIARTLLRWADVLVINMRVETRKRRGLTYEDVSAINPRLVYASITGYGDEGPEADLPGADITIQARVGDIGGRTLEGQPPPTHTFLYHFDMAAAMLVAYGVTLALLRRQTTGQGDKVEANLLQSAIACQAIQMTRRASSKERHPVQPNGLPISYRCADGRYILSQYINLGPRWSVLAGDLGSDELMNDPRFATPQERQQHIPEIAAILERVFLTRPSDEWEKLLRGKGHMMSVVKDIDEVFEDPQVKANDMIIEFDQPGVGSVEAIGQSFRLQSCLGEMWLRRPVPAKGEHTDEILRQLGIGKDNIDLLRSDGVVA